MGQRISIESKMPRRMENMNLSWILRKSTFPEERISEEHFKSTVLSSQSLGLLFRISCWGYSFLNGKNGNSPPSQLALVSFVLYSLYRKPLLVVTWPWSKPTAGPVEVQEGLLLPHEASGTPTSGNDEELRVLGANESERGGQTGS